MPEYRYFLGATPKTWIWLGPLILVAAGNAIFLLIALDW